MSTSTTERRVVALLDRCGRTYPEQAGIQLSDRPAPVYQLLVLATLISARISADVATAAARELFQAGYRTPRRMVEASWQDRVDALGRGHYRRYDERTATMLGTAAQLCLERWRGDLRRLRAAAAGDRTRLRSLLTEFPGMGPTGADVFVREVQGVWPEFAPFVDSKVAAGARTLRLPQSPAALARRAPDGDLPRLASALVRVAVDKSLAADLRSVLDEGA